VPNLPPPPADVLARQRALAALPAGVVRDETGRLWAEKDGAELVHIPEGAFDMGSDAGSADEKPVHRVHLSAYLMDRHEVTNAMFDRFVKATNHRTDAEKEGNGRALVGGNWSEVNGAYWRAPQGPGSNIAGLEHHPVVLVSWSDAKTYADWAGRPLPTEAQFEKALRGGLSGKTYPWGDELPPRGKPGNYADATFKRANPAYSAVEGYDDGYERTSPAGAMTMNGYGLYDITGNVWEWCADWYDAAYYGQSSDRDPQGPSNGSLRVLRGGSWLNYPTLLRAALRLRYGPTHRDDNVGFRLARGL
jgi:formylglycine-generating enzyme required for sulfatase activity